MSAANPTPQMMVQNNYTTVGPSNLANPPLSSENMHHDGEDELIPTAIVIKNIPFAVKKEQLLDLMTRMRLPLPYAFNYHFDNGVFRGLAFANFTTHGETLEVIERLNHCDVAGRKLRVEFKRCFRFMNGSVSSGRSASEGVSSRSSTGPQHTIRLCHP